MRLVWGDYELDEEQFELRRAGVRVPVQRKVLELLFYLVRARDRVVLRTELLENLWPDVAVSEASISRAVLQARRAIGDELQEMVVTVRGKGLRFVLDAVEKGPQESTGIATADAAIDPTFVGRSSAMTSLRARLEEAVLGRGGVVWISGDAGIGKTRMLGEFVRRARARGATVCSASVHETPASPQFWLWAQITRAFAATQASPATSQFLDSVAPLLHGDSALPDASRFVLFDAWTRFFVEASRTRPLVFALDDVSWADEGSLGLLRFVAREIRDAAVLVVGTFRDVDQTTGTRGRAFGEVLGECTGLTIPLRGLTLDEIPRFVELATGTTPPAPFTNALLERTGGSPLYLGQVLQTEWAARALTESSHESSSMDLQQGLVESIARHVQSISRESRDLLTLAAVLGREFEFPELALVSGLGTTEMLNRLDDGARARIVVKSKAGAYRFTHALVHEVLYKSLSLAERASKHAQIAAALLTHYGPSSDVHAADLAFHFTRALPGGSPDHAVDFSVRAAERELGREGYRNAMRHWKDATKALAHVAADDPRHVAVKLGSARTHAALGDEATAQESFLDAALLARAASDAEALAEAALGFAALTPRDASGRRALLTEAREALRSKKGEAASAKRAALDAALTT